MNRLLIAIGLLGLLASIASARGQTPADPKTTAKPAPTTTGNAATGRQLYLDYSCYACHGFDGQTGNGPRLLPPRLNQQQFVLYIRTPRTPQMPAYSTKLLTDAQAADIYAYVLSLPREPELKDVPLLKELPQ